MSTKKKWLDLSSFGAQLVVTPKTDLRNQAAIIKIKDVELLEKKLNTSLNSFLTGLNRLESLFISPMSKITTLVLCIRVRKIVSLLLT